MINWIKSLLKFHIAQAKRLREAEYQISKLIDDNEMLGRLVLIHKKKADRLERQMEHPRQNGKFARVIPITKVEFKS